jgi:translocation protein SEC63
MGDPTESHGNLFPIFLLSLFQFFLVPITIGRVGSWQADRFRREIDDKSNIVSIATTMPTDTTSDWGKAQAARAVRARPTVGRKLRALLSGFNLVLVIGWTLSALLVVHIARTQGPETTVFDPYNILSVPLGADATTIKKAYRRLSLQYHPDKNPDPEAHLFFTDSITPAYKALTNDIARENFERYGHPDGKQPVRLGVALPQWMFGQDGTGPLILCLLVGIGILLPLAMAVVAILNLNRYGGSSGGVLKQSITHFAGELRPNLSTAKVPKLISVAAEFILIPYRREQVEPVRRLLTALRGEYDVKDPKFQRRHPSVIKAHMLLLAQACRKIDQVSSLLEEDLKMVLAMMPRLWDEALKLTLLPYNQLGYCYLRPTLSFLEFAQCFTQAVSPSTRKGDSSEGLVSLLQLPHVDEKTALLLSRKKCRSLGELLAFPGGVDTRRDLFTQVGLSDGQVVDLEAFLLFVPKVDLFAASLETVGQEEICSMDIVTCTINLRLRRGALGDDTEGVVVTEGNLPPLPFCLHCERTEGWWLIVADTAANSILSHQRLDADILRQAQLMPNGRTLQLTFPVGNPGNYSLQVILLSDYWIGADAKLAVKIKVLKRTKEILLSRKEANEGKSTKKVSSAVKGNIDLKKNAHEGVSESDSSDSEHSGSAGAYGGDYPSEETGTEESSDDDEEFFGRNYDAIATRKAGKEQRKNTHKVNDASESASSTRGSGTLQPAQKKAAEDKSARGTNN